MTIIPEVSRNHKKQSAFFGIMGPFSDPRRGCAAPTAAKVVICSLYSRLLHVIIWMNNHTDRVFRAVSGHRRVTGRINSDRGQNGQSERKMQLNGIHRRIFIVPAAILMILMMLISGCRTGGSIKGGKTNRMPAAVVDGKFCIAEADGSYREQFLNGVNIGAASYGNFPGEFGIDKETYLRWFGYIGDMNVQVIRVYVNQMPAFYEALAEYNKKAARPLYLLQGVYCSEDLIEKYRNAYNEEFRASFVKDIEDAVDIIHGNAGIEKVPGSAGGTYKADVSEWVIGWILGIEWSADFVNATNEAEPERNTFRGTYVSTKDASPFEAFLAEAAETAIRKDLEGYGTQRPVALCNWCTTDPLEHPNEPNPEAEDSAVVDAEHIIAAQAFQAGFFASYHVYPYYPEFLSYDVKYLDGDKPDPYLAYLRELTAYHTMPVLISEYGIPSSRGIAHANAVTGMSQGYADEAQQGRWLVSLNRDIRSAGCCGGLIFSWQDEWFKRNWNTMDYEAADRRPFWHNVQCPEECFGLLAFESGEKEAPAVIDGDDAEWKDEQPVISQDGLSVYAKNDAAYLYLLVRGENWDFEKDRLFIPLDVLKGAGNTHTGDLTFSEGAEFLLTLHGKEDSVLTVDASYDVFQYSYARLHAFFEELPGQYEKDAGYFNPIYLAMNRPMLLPQTGETTPFERFETGRLHYENAREDTLSDFCAGNGLVEIRLPWQLIGFMDPSSKLVIGDLIEADGRIEPAPSDGVRIGIVREKSADPAVMALYSWENWEIPEAHERLKTSYSILKDYFAGTEQE